MRSFARPDLIVFPRDFGGVHFLRAVHRVRILPIELIERGPRDRPWSQFFTWPILFGLRSIGCRSVEPGVERVSRRPSWTGTRAQINPICASEASIFDPARAGFSRLQI